MQFPNEILKQCWFLAGPTASGKTSTGIALAHLINAEIVSMDSMAIFREMDIGTAKPTAEEQSQAVHHLIDVADPHEDFSTADYLTQSLHVCEDILERGKVPLFVGGTGLYLRSVLRGVFDGPPADWEFRKQLESEAASQAPSWLHEQLLVQDPQRASELHPNDTRRIVRALEIIKLTGKPASQQAQQQVLPQEKRPANVLWISSPREWLYDRINGRVDSMIEQGLIEETQRLIDREPPIGRTARQALGYRETIDFLEGRIENKEELIEQIQTNTRQFAKRQVTWFRNLEECNEFSIRGDESAADLAQRIVDGQIDN